jgi:hypothetical protein
VARIKRLTDGRGVDVAIEALGRQETFENALRAIRPGGTLSSLGVYSGKLVAPYEALYAGLGDQRIVTTLCPGGKERMRRLMELIAHRRVDLQPLVTHSFTLDQIQDAFEMFSQQRKGVLKNRAASVRGGVDAGGPRRRQPRRDGLTDVTRAASSIRLEQERLAGSRAETRPAIR